MKKLNFTRLHEGDIVCTTSISAFATGIRLREAGPLSLFNTSIATHVGIIIDLGANNGAQMFKIAEMLDKLRVNSLSDYTNNGFFGKRIVKIVRHPCFNDPERTKLMRQFVLGWWEEGKSYDIAGVLSFIMPFLKGKNSKFFCSEMVSWLVHNVGCDKLVEKTGDSVTPNEIQFTKTCQEVTGIYLP